MVENFCKKNLPLLHHDFTLQQGVFSTFLKYSTFLSKLELLRPRNANFTRRERIVRSVGQVDETLCALPVVTGGRGDGGRSGLRTELSITVLVRAIIEQRSSSHCPPNTFSLHQRAGGLTGAAVLWKC